MEKVEQLALHTSRLTFWVLMNQFVERSSWSNGRDDGLNRCSCYIVSGKCVRQVLLLTRAVNHFNVRPCSITIYYFPPDGLSAVADRREQRLNGRRHCRPPCRSAGGPVKVNNWLARTPSTLHKKRIPSRCVKTTGSSCISLRQIHALKHSNEAGAAIRARPAPWC